jgi:uncharacterized tellurite resistance protein B-like protein
MIRIFKNFFCSALNDEISTSKSNRPHKLHVATCAILLEMAKVDGEFNDSERQDIIAVFKNKYQLTDYEISSLIEAAEKELERSIDLWQFTNEINKNYSPDEKIRIINTIWQIAYADGKLDNHEDYLIHKLSDLLNISHKDLIEAKLKVIQSRPV